MKGPSGRLKFDVRRLWECPRCQRRDATPGLVVARLCPQCPDATWMKLVEGKSAKPAPDTEPLAGASP